MRQISDHAAAAKMIRAELKKNGIAASVRASAASMTSSVNVSLPGVAPWIAEAVESFACRFQYGHFDGMVDCYEYSNRIEGVPQVKFVFVSNEFTAEQRASAYRFLRDNMHGYSDLPENYEDARDLRAKGCHNWVSHEVRRVLHGSLLNDGATRFWSKPRITLAA